jgi:hypothetical protein
MGTLKETVVTQPNPDSKLAAYPPYQPFWEANPEAYPSHPKAYPLKYAYKEYTNSVFRWTLS